MAEYREQLNEDQENQIINEEYKIWKKNCPYLYDLVITHEMRIRINARENRRLAPRDARCVRAPLSHMRN